MFINNIATLTLDAPFHRFVLLYSFSADEDSVVRAAREVHRFYKDQAWSYGTIQRMQFIIAIEICVCEDMSVLLNFFLIGYLSDSEGVKKSMEEYEG